MRVDKAVYAALDEMLTAQLKLAQRRGVAPDGSVEGDAAFHRAFHTLLSPAHRARYLADVQRRHRRVDERFVALFGANAGRHMRVPAPALTARQVGSNFTGFGKRNTGRSTLRTGNAQFRTVEGSLAARLRDGVDGSLPAEHEHAYMGLRRGDSVHVEVHCDPKRATDTLFGGTRCGLQPVACMAAVGLTSPVWVRAKQCVAASGNTTVVLASVL
jgi:hypothetical protein